jgi:hypothetical protein
MPKVTIEDLQQRADRLTALAKTLEGETDGAKIIEVSQQLQEMGNQLQALAQQFEKENPQQTPKKAFVEVQLTPGQQRRIRQETGIDLVTRARESRVTRTSRRRWISSSATLKRRSSLTP